MDAPTLQTERLVLRALAPEDFDAFAAMCADPEVMRFLGGVQPRSVAWRGFTSVAGSWAMQGFGMFSVIERTSGRWIGRIGPHRPEGWPGTEVGWGLVQDAWGKGYAVEAASAAMDFAVDQLGWTEVIHCIEDGNTASQNVAKRLGSSLLRVAKLPPPIDAEIDVWGQTAQEWRARPD
ncbi:MAG: GNAT family N-acetyltransferase [Caulobacteraceae bacterium]